MGFYLRKSFKAGPVRFNLSKSGVGVSAGVKGFRVGSGPRGPYVHAGRHGLYYRKSLSGTNTLSDGRELTELPKIERLTAADVFQSAQVHESHTGAFSSLPGVGRGWLVLFPVYVVLAALHSLRRSRAERYVSDLVGLARSLTRLDDDVSRRADFLRQSYRLPERYLAWAHESVYEHALSMVLADFVVTEDEMRWLTMLETLLGMPQGRAMDLKADWYKAVYMSAVSDRVLTDEEESQLESIRTGLGVADEEIAPELETVARLRKVREIGKDRLEPIESSVRLPAGETCFFEGPGRVLSRRVISRFRRGGVQYKETGLLSQREGTLVITSRRLLVVGEGQTAVSLDKILDVEVDPDMNLISITVDNRKNPIHLTTPESLVAGALIHELAGSHFKH